MEYPYHVIAYWLDQSTKVALEHYIHPTDDQYNQAITAPTRPLKSSGDIPSKVSQNAETPTTPE